MIFLSCIIIDTMKKCRLAFFIIILTLFLPILSSGEGTKELRPTSADVAIMYISSSGPTNFATANCLPKYRLNIRIANAGEKILFGFKKSGTQTANYTLRKPDGTIAKTGACPTSGQGFISGYAQAIQGPFPGNGGYDPLSYSVTSIADTGDFFMEFSGSSGIQLTEFDFQVVTGINTPALPGDTINGRVWSGGWQLYANLNTIPVEKFSGKIYIYSDDGIVTSCKFKDMAVGLFSIFCNQYGCFNTGDFTSDRKSKNTNTALTFPGIAQYKIFLNNPDINVYPDGVYGLMTAAPTITPDPAFPVCSGNKIFNINVNKPGNVEIFIDIPYGDPTYDVALYAPVQIGANSIPWDGKDGQGNLVPFGSELAITVNYANGLSNMPLWDVETNPLGLTVQLERPINILGSSPQTYWDDTDIVLTGGGISCSVFPIGSNLTGCSPTPTTGCHPWQNTCHDKMINTWWYSGGASSTTLNTVFTGAIPAPVTSPQWVCGGGNSITLSASVANIQHNVRWWSAETGGTLLHTGLSYETDTLPVGVHHFYAETFEPATSCTSSERVDAAVTVVAIPDAPVPYGFPFFTCGSGTVTMNAANTNPGIRIDWYDDATPANKLASGNSFTTPVLSTSTTYYCEAVDIGLPFDCSSATRTTFFAEVRPIPMISNTVTEQSLCSGGSPTITFSSVPPGSTYSWTADNPDGRVVGYSPSGIGDITAEVLSIIQGASEPGVVTYHVAPTLDLCQGLPESFVITVDPLEQISVSISASATEVCEGTNVIFTATSPSSGPSHSFQWEKNGSSISGATNSTYSYIPENGDVIACVVASSSWCIFGSPVAISNAINMVVHPNETVSVSISASDNHICAGTIVSFIAYPESGSASISYQWIKGGTSIPGATNASYSYAPDDGDEIRCVLTSDAECITGNPATSNGITITVTPALPLSLSITSSANNICAGTGVTFNTITVNAGTTPVYQWKKGGANIVGATNSVYSYTPSNGDLITCQVTSNAACITGNPATSNAIAMTVNPLLPVSVMVFASSTYVCEGNSLTFFANSFNGGTTPVYQWKVNGISVGTNSQFYTYVPSNNDLVNCMVTSSIACPANNPAVSNMMPVIVNSSQPVSVIIEASQNQVCAGNAVTFTTMAVNPGNNPNYEWRVNNNAIIGATESSYTFIPNDGDQVKCILTSSELCPVGSPASSNTIITQVNPLPVPSISGPASACLNAVGNVYSTHPSMNNYSWVVNGGTITDGGGYSSNSVSVTWVSPGLQSLSVNYINEFGCTAGSSTIFPVTVSASLAPGTPGNISGTSTVAPGQANVLFSVPAIPFASNYIWQLPPGASITSGMNTNQIMVTFSTTATSGHITVTGSNNCGNGPVSNGFFISVGNTLPVVLSIYNINLSNGVTRCYNATHNIIVAGNGSQFNALSGSSLTLIAGMKILLKPGTRLFNGCYMHGYITTTGNYCQNPAAPIVAVATGEEELPLLSDEKQMFRVYPNPTGGDFTIEAFSSELQEPVMLELYSLTGEKVLQRHGVALGRHTLSLTGKPSGLYLLRILSGQGTETFKVLKR